MKSRIYEGQITEWESQKRTVIERERPEEVAYKHQRNGHYKNSQWILRKRNIKREIKKRERNNTATTITDRSHDCFLWRNEPFAYSFIANFFLPHARFILIYNVWVHLYVLGTILTLSPFFFLAILFFTAQRTDALANVGEKFYFDCSVANDFRLE